MSKKKCMENQNERNERISPEVKKFMDDLHSPLGEDAMKSLYDLGLKAETIEKFQLGYDANPESRNFNRVIIPHYDENGNLCGYTGRAVDKDVEPKYIITYFSGTIKQFMLFGINHAKSSSADYFIICEGEIDAMLLHQNGFDSAVALTRAPLYPVQAVRLKKYKNKVIAFFDNDNIGRRMVADASDLLEDTGITAREVSFEGIPDPATLMRRDGGREELAMAIANCG